MGFRNCILGNHQQFSPKKQFLTRPLPPSLQIYAKNTTVQVWTVRVWWSERGPLQGLGAGVKHCKSSSLIKLLGNRIQQLDVLCKACVLPGLKETWAQQDLRMPLYNSCTFKAYTYIFNKGSGKVRFSNLVTYVRLMHFWGWTRPEIKRDLRMPSYCSCTFRAETWLKASRKMECNQIKGA